MTMMHHEFPCDRNMFRNFEAFRDFRQSLFYLRDSITISIKIEIAMVGGSY